MVSVLFADLVGFTARAESLDPEDVEAILRPFHDRLRTELEQRGGTVEKFIGDAVMAVFGAPVAHEDDAERAVRSALAIRDWIREEEELEVRIAVNTGEALVSLEPSPGAERGLVAGDVVNTASRLQAAAPVNGILVGEMTYNATARVIEYRDAAAVEARGKSEPVPVWEAVQARSRFGSDLRRSTTPLVGRERELDLLFGLLARVEEERSPQLVTLVGVPGIGKTRLVHELFQAVDQRPELIYWRQGRCLPYGDGVAYWALGEIVKAHAGILEGEAAERVEEKLRAVVDEAVPDTRETAWVVGKLRPLVGLSDGEDSGGDRRLESFAAWRRFFEGLAELDPLVIVVEDLHWADEGVLDFVDHLVDWSSGVPILVVGTARPELLTMRPGWGGGKQNATTISLSPLSEQETTALIHGLLNRAVLPAELQATLLDRAGGNPLYAEEFARIASERGDLGADTPLPESVQGLIAARLDALPHDEKALVQDASVVGKVFWTGAVAQLADLDPDALRTLLHRLERKQFLQRERRSSIEGDTQYAFAHSIVREVAYSQIPRSERTEKHRRAASWIESIGRSEDLADLRAHHYRSALEALPASDDPQLRRAARLALRDAGDRAAALHAYAAAAHDYDRALALWPEDDPERPSLLMAAAVARAREDVWEPDELAAARDALIAAGDVAAAAEAEIWRAEVYWNLGQGDDVLASLQRGAALAEPLPVSAAKARVYTGLCRLHWLATREEETERYGNEALAMAEQLGLDEERGHLLNTFGSSRLMKGDRGGFDDLHESVRLLEHVHSTDAQRPYNNLADGFYNLGELDKAAEAAARMRQALERYGGLDWLRWAESQHIRVLYMAGRWDETLAIADRWVADTLERPGHYLESFWRWHRTRIYLARAERDLAAEDGERAVVAARSAADPQVLLPALAFQSHLLWALGDPAAEGMVRELASLCREFTLDISHEWFSDAAIVLGALEMRSELDKIAASVPTPTPWRDAGLALGRGDPLRAAEIFRSINARPCEAEARLLAARVGIDADLPSAVAFFREVGARAYLDEAEGLLATSRSA